MKDPTSPRFLYVYVHIRINHIYICVVILMLKKGGGLHRITITMLQYTNTI